MRNKSYYYSKKKAVKYHELVADNDVFEYSLIYLKT